MPNAIDAGYLGGRAEARQPARANVGLQKKCSPEVLRRREIPLGVLLGPVALGFLELGRTLALLAG